MARELIPGLVAPLRGPVRLAHSGGKIRGPQPRAGEPNTCYFEVN